MLTLQITKACIFEKDNKSRNLEVQTYNIINEQKKVHKDLVRKEGAHPKF